VATQVFAPKHAGLQRTGPKAQVRHFDLPPWHGWRWTSEHQRIIRWIEKTLIIPVGRGQGYAFKLAPFQKALLKDLVASLATFISIPVGNGKTRLMAAVGLERLCRGDHYVEVDVLATNEKQARRLVDACIEFIEASPELNMLVDQHLIEFYKGDGILEYKPTGSRLTAYPAKLSAIQGLNSTLALIDEIGMVPPELVTSMLARLGKREQQRVVGFGTPGFRPDNMLETLRVMAHEERLPAGVKFVEYVGEAGCDLMDEQQWRRANPAIAAGFLGLDEMRVKLALMAERGQESEARAYHLGQPIEGTALWLPYQVWAECMQSDPPRDQTPVVLGVWGNYHRRVAVVGCTLDGSVFFGWEAERATDEELERVLVSAMDQYDVREIVHKPHVRLSLMGRLADNGLPAVPWPAAGKLTDVETDSTAALYQTIVEGRLGHDHHPILTEQVSRLTAQVDRRGNPRLVESSDADVAAALAMRAAWWRARCLAEEDTGEELTIY